MMDNSFEKQIRNKVGQAEVGPSVDLFDAIMEKRTTKAKPFLGLGYAKLFLLTAIAAVTAGVWYFTLHENGRATNSQPEAVLLQPAESGSVNSEQAMAKLQESEQAENKVVPHAGAEQLSNKSLKNKKSNKAHSSSRIQFADHSANYQNTPSKKGIKKIKNGFFGKSTWLNPDPNAYFDVDAANRPAIDYAQHKGNSHLFVYETVNPELLENEILRYTNASHISKIQYPIVFEALSPVKTDKIQYTINNKHRKPLFVDLLFTQVYGTTKTGDAAANQLKNGTMNQQIGIRVSAPVKGHLSVFAGLGYMNQIIHYRGDLPYTEAYTNINTKVTFINDPVKGVIRVETKDTVNGIANKSRKIDMKNTYSLFRLPIGIGYNFGLGKFDFTLYGSLDINLLSAFTANNKIYEANPVVYYSNSKSLHFGSGLSLMSAYKISPRFRLIAEPGMHYFQLNHSKTGNFASEKIYNFTGTLGLRYSLF